MPDQRLNQSSPNASICEKQTQKPDEMESISPEIATAKNIWLRREG